MECGFCQELFHRNCVGLKSRQSLWICPFCKEIPQTIQTLISQQGAQEKEIADLRNENVTLLNLVEEQRSSLAELQDTLNHQRDHHDCVVEPTDVPATDDTPQPEPVPSASSSNPAPAQQTLIIGDSMIRDIQEKGLVKTTVQCLRGGRMANINAELIKINPEQYTAIVVHRDTNDCVSDTKSTEGSTHYEELIESIRDKAPSTKLIISTICPRVDDAKNNERVQQFNRNLRVLATEKGCVLVDNDGNFYLRNDEVDKENLTLKGLHLSKVHVNEVRLSIPIHFPLVSDVLKVPDRELIQNFATYLRESVKCKVGFISCN